MGEVVKNHYGGLVGLVLTDLNKVRIPEIGQLENSEMSNRTWRRGNKETYRRLYRLRKSQRRAEYDQLGGTDCLVKGIER